MFGAQNKLIAIRCREVPLELRFDLKYFPLKPRDEKLREEHLEQIQRNCANNAAEKTRMIK